MGLRVGITGGIGAGKSIVCRLFQVLSIPVYDADREAKSIMVEDDAVVASLKKAFGEKVYQASGELDRAYLAEMVFNDKDKLDELNSIVHPAVIRAGETWADAQEGAYSLKEAALLFESGSYKKLDFTIMVTANEATRIQRVMERDQVTEQQVRARMEKQWPDSQKIALADAIIVNDGTESLISQVMTLHERLLNYEK
ncbi:dephospho-CoA kinase [Sphingobacterium corticibacter]|uniref:Dephospho-CoA kinase n=1 Tax=Sphingobacterium corticibacter TaxID=2171749 RepID=A0A2T8HGR8_9SPHI|nr:dephospho-CoA kinase [Sphingobacterium corticibacter]PVH24615.1 dephospho-CoA kinase [Sphingobacterium corticibacter]